MHQAIRTAVVAGLLLALTGTTLLAQRYVRYPRYPTYPPGGIRPTTTGKTTPTTTGKTTTGKTGQSAARVVINVTLSTGPKVRLSASGSPLTGSGLMAGPDYPMSVTGGVIQGPYITVYGIIQGSKSRMTYKLVVNRLSGNAYLFIGTGGSLVTGKGTWGVQS